MVAGVTASLERDCEKQVCSSPVSSFAELVVGAVGFLGKVGNRREPESWLGAGWSLAVAKSGGCRSLYSELGLL